MNRESRASFWLLCAFGFLAFVSYDIIRSPLLPLFAVELGATPQSIGLIVGASTITGIFFKFPSGALSDVLGRRKMLFLGLLIFAVVPYSYWWVHDLWLLLAVRFLHGFATAIFAPVAMAMVAELLPERRGEALGWYSSFTQAGRIVGGVAGGYLISDLVFGRGFLASAMIGLVILLLFTMFKPGDRLGTTSHVDKKGISMREMLDGMKQVAMDTRILATSGMEAFQMLASGALMAFLPLYGILIGFHPGQVGVLIGARGLPSILGRPVMGRVSDRIGRRPLIIAGQAVCAVTVALLPWTENFWMLLCLSFLFGLGEAVMLPSTSALVADLCSTRSFGSAMGVFGSVMDMGHASGPILTGLIVGFFGYRAAFGTVAVLLVLMMLIFIQIVRSPHMGSGDPSKSS